jgi:peptide chain release factor 1
MRIGSAFDISLKKLSDGFISFEVNGNKAYEKFRHEAGAIRWQRIPPTESKGRYHTSTITVVVLKNNTFPNITIQEKDLEWQYCRGRGKGGQNRNKRDTAVWLKHKSSGIQIRSEEERTQGMNKANALCRLKEKLELSQRNLSFSKDTKERREQAGEGNRSIYSRTIKERDNVVINHITGKKITFKKYKKGNLRQLIE